MVGGWTLRRCGMRCSSAWCGTPPPPVLEVVNMRGTHTFTCYMGALCCNNEPCMSRLLAIVRFALFAIWSFCALTVACAVLGRGGEPPRFWGLSIWPPPGLSHVTWVHYDATMCLACLICWVLLVLYFLRFGLLVLWLVRTGLEHWLSRGLSRDNLAIALVNAPKLVIARVIAEVIALHFLLFHVSPFRFSSQILYKGP